MELCFLFLVSAHFLGPVARNISRRFTSPGGGRITYLSAVHFIDIHKYPSMCPILSVSLCTSPSGFYTSHCISVRCQICRYDHDGDPLTVLVSICFDAFTPVLWVLNVLLDHGMLILFDETTQRCRACCKPITLTGRNKKEYYGPCVITCESYCLWHLLFDRVMHKKYMF